MSEKHKISDDDGINGKGNNKKSRPSEGILEKNNEKLNSDFSLTSDTNSVQVVQNSNEPNLPVSESEEFHKNPLVTDSTRIIENERKPENQQATGNKQLPENQTVAEYRQLPENKQVSESQIVPENPQVPDDPPRRRRIRRIRCHQCANCLRDNCRACLHCIDMKKYGGPGTLKQTCIRRNCLNPIIR